MVKSGDATVVATYSLLIPTTVPYVTPLSSITIHIDYTKKPLSSLCHIKYNSDTYILTEPIPHNPFCSSFSPVGVNDLGFRFQDESSSRRKHGAGDGIPKYGQGMKATDLSIYLPPPYLPEYLPT